MFASLFARTSQGISYPFLYLNSAASPLALLTDARASAIDPVITQPTDGDSLKMCDTEEGSISLSSKTLTLVIILEVLGASTHWYFLLREHYRAALPSNSDRCDVGSSDGFEGVF